MAQAVLSSAPLRLGRLKFPSGHSLPSSSWERRHRGILVILALHALGLIAFGLYMRESPVHAVLEGGVVALLCLVAAQGRLARRARSVAAAFGLMSSSAILTHLSGGYIEAHFHFFVMLGVIFLYEDWLPYALAVGYVAIHHGIMGTFDPLSVYNHPDAIARPWLWASIHAVFIMGLSAALLVAWNIIESARTSETKALAEAQELKRQVHSQEKMAALGSLVAGLAHEVRTPLTVVSASAGLLEMAAARDPQNPLSPRVLAQAAEIQAGVERINGLVGQLRRFHALRPEDLRAVPLDEVVRDAMRLFGSAHKGTVQVRLDLDPTPLARVHSLGVHQVVLNLVTNAVEASDPVKGLVTVRTTTEEGWPVLVVEDNGAGMGDEARRRAFDPLFTTKKDGMGLGLHIVKRIVEAHEGTIRFTSGGPHGGRARSRFGVRLRGSRDSTAKADRTCARRPRRGTCR
jgi:signal transduction histidine kinase